MTLVGEGVSEHQTKRVQPKEVLSSNAFKDSTIRSCGKVANKWKLNVNDPCGWSKDGTDAPVPIQIKPIINF